MPIDCPPAVHASYTAPKDQQFVATFEKGKNVGKFSKNHFIVATNQFELGGVLSGSGLGNTKGAVSIHDGKEFVNLAGSFGGNRKMLERGDQPREPQVQGAKQRRRSMLYSDVVHQVKTSFVPAHLQGEQKEESPNRTEKEQLWDRLSYLFFPEFGETNSGNQTVTLHFAQENDRHAAQEMFGDQITGMIAYKNNEGELCEEPYTMQISYTDSNPHILKLYRKYVDLKKIKKSRQDPEGRLTARGATKKYPREGREPYNRFHENEIINYELEQHFVNSQEDARLEAIQQQFAFEKQRMRDDLFVLLQYPEKDRDLVNGLINHEERKKDLFAQIETFDKNLVEDQIEGYEEYRRNPNQVNYT